MTNVLDSYSHGSQSRWQRLSPLKKTIIAIVGVVVVLFLVIALWAVVNARAAKTAVSEALEGKQSLEYAQVAINKQDFEKAEKDLREAKIHFAESRESMQRFRVFKAVPGIAPQVKAADQMLVAATNLSSALEKVAGLGGQINDVIGTKKGDVAFADISAEDKGHILKVLSESTVDLQAVQADLELASLAIEEIPDKGLIAPVREAVSPIKEQLPLLQSVITQAIPLAESLPSIMGYPGEKKYLFLLQNNNELRPTGGFIGTYGILRVKNGEIVEFYTDNIYNLDVPAAERVTEPAPYPIARHTSTQNNLMRNINWDPHFPATAVKAEEKYYEEAQKNEDFDGVIAVTPRFIASLLALTGPITADNTKFTSENLVQTLQDKTEREFVSEGRDESERKEVIGVLANTLIDEVFKLPKSKLPDIWNAFVTNVDEKQILLYVEDPATQRLIVEQNWAGEMKPYTSDYLAVIDANLAALKTDANMDRSLSYLVTKEGNDYIATVDMTYTNRTQRIDFFHTRYRTWTRFFVPLGAELLEADGFLTGDIPVQKGKPTKPDVGTATAKQADGTTTTYTIFEGFTAIEPKQTGTLHLKYKLPESVVKTIERGEYELLVQKQAGTVAHGLQAEFNFGKGIDKIHALDTEAKIEDNKASVTGDLRKDRRIQIGL